MINTGQDQGRKIRDVAPEEKMQGIDQHPQPLLLDSSRLVFTSPHVTTYTSHNAPPCFQVGAIGQLIHGSNTDIDVKIEYYASYYVSFPFQNRGRTSLR